MRLACVRALLQAPAAVARCIGGRVPAIERAAPRFLARTVSSQSRGEDPTIGEAWRPVRTPKRKKKKSKSKQLREEYQRMQGHAVDSSALYQEANKDRDLPRYSPARSFAPTPAAAAAAAAEAITVKKAADSQSTAFAWRPPFKKPRQKYQVGRPMPPKEACSRHAPLDPSSRSSSKNSSSKIPSSREHIPSRAQERTAMHLAKRGL